MKKLIALFAALFFAASIASPAGSITKGGTLDGDDHPYVGLMVAGGGDSTETFAPGWRCTGTLISPTVYVTAGHCTEGATHVELWFASDLEPDPTGDYGYPFVGEVSGDPYDYPGYLPGAFWFADLGVVVLDEPVYLDSYASLPSVGYVDEYIGARGRNSTVTAVGYGLQSASVNGKKDQADKTRLQAELMVVNTNGVVGMGNVPGTNSMILSGDAKHGGTCFGDSGGPSLDGDVLVAVTSFGLNSNCAGIGGVYRIDSAPALEWIESFLD